jgi:hypothetical protein
MLCTHSLRLANGSKEDVRTGNRSFSLHLRPRAQCRRAALLMCVLVVAGCASDYVPRTDAPASAQTYQADLDSCQSSAAAARAANGAEGFFAGALWGAANGAVIGAHDGGAGMGAAIGAGVGAVIGLTQALTRSDYRFVSSCMHGKGYRRA